MQITSKIFTNTYSADGTPSAKSALWDCSTDEPRDYKNVRVPLAVHNGGNSDEIDAALITEITGAP